MSASSPVMLLLGVVWLLAGSCAALGTSRVPRVVCLGEVLFDSLPHGVFLGGAPLNVAMHAAALGAETSLLSCIGADQLGRDATRRIQLGGVDVTGLQVSESLTTGFVTCSICATSGDASYEFATPAAWDHVEETPGLIEAVTGADALVHGSLALRDERTARTLAVAAMGAKRRVFDLNLRQPFVNRGRIEKLMHNCWILKMNEDELHEVANWCGLPPVEDEHLVELIRVCAGIREHYAAENLVLTRAEKGAMLLSEDGCTQVALSESALTIEDTVGAGDAFTARLTTGFLSGETREEALKASSLLATWVATQQGGTPAHDHTLQEFLKTHTANTLQ